MTRHPTIPYEHEIQKIRIHGSDELEGKRKRSKSDIFYIILYPHIMSFTQNVNAAKMSPILKVVKTNLPFPRNFQMFPKLSVTS